MRARAGAAFGRVVFSAALLVACVRPLHAGHYAWTTSGPQPGSLFQILVKPDDPSRLAATAGFYGPMLFLSTDAGQSWTQTPGVFSGRIVSNPSVPNALYALGGVGPLSGVLKSADWGASWTSANSGLPPQPFSLALSAAPSQPQTLYGVHGGSPGSVYRTDDGAGSWTLVASTFPSIYTNDVEVDPLDADVLYADVGSDIAKSIDGGVTWSGTGLGFGAYRIVIDPSNPLRIFVATIGAGVWVSTDGAVSWTPANVGIETANVRDLALDPSDPQKLWAAVQASQSSGGIFRTTNAHDWSPVDLGEPVANATAIAIERVDPAVVYAGGGASVLLGGVFRTSDGGSQWTRSDSGISGYFSQGVAASPTQTGEAFGVSFAKVFHTDDSGARWELRADTEFGLISLLGDPTDPETLYAGYVIPAGGGNGVLKSIDGGNEWNPAIDGLAINTLTRLAICPSSPDHLLAASYEGLFGTTNGGDHWDPLFPGFVPAAALDPSDPSILYAGLQITTPTGNGLLRSVDGGASWNPVAGIPDGYFHASDIFAPANDPQRVYVASQTGVFRSVDRGLSFAPAGAGLPPTPGIVLVRIGGDPSTPGVLYLLAGLGGAVSDIATDTVFANVFRTTDGAGSWKPLPGALPLFGPLEISVGASGRVLYASSASGLFEFERSFLDVPDGDVFWVPVDAAAMNGVTAGCGGGNFCPDADELRYAIAAFLLRGKNGPLYAPPSATGAVFGDVAVDTPGADFIEELFHEGITVGCGGGNYCPAAPLSRAEVSVLLLKAEHGGDYQPPPATGTVFTDVPADAFAAAWIEQLFLEGVTAGCGGGRFCPDASVSREQAAAFVVRIFGLS